jgi:hypothetical protein
VPISLVGSYNEYLISIFILHSSSSCAAIKDKIVNETDLPPRVTEPPAFEDLVKSTDVGVAVAEGNENGDGGDIWFRCPIGVVSQRDGYV